MFLDPRPFSIGSGETLGFGLPHRSLLVSYTSRFLWLDTIRAKSCWTTSTFRVPFIHLQTKLKFFVDYEMESLSEALLLKWNPLTTPVSMLHFIVESMPVHSQVYYGRRCSTLLHSYCTCTYTKVTVLLFWGNSAVTMKYLHSYFVEVPAWVLQGNSEATSHEQHCYFCVGTSAVTVQ